MQVMHIKTKPLCVFMCVCFKLSLHNNYPVDMYSGVKSVWIL